MFKNNKYTKWYFSIINSAKKQDRQKKYNHYFESHHIIPKCLGGVEEVLLTAKEHFICHLILCKMLEGQNKYKMINALIKLAYSSSKGQKRYTARSYSLVKKLIAEKNSALFKGKPKSEETKRRMKGKSGKWVRTNEYRNKRSEIQKKEYITNPMRYKGLIQNSEKGFTKEMVERRNKTRKEKNIVPSFTGKGYAHYTNGVLCKRCIPGTEPDGFYPGRIIKKGKDNASPQKQTKNRAT